MTITGIIAVEGKNISSVYLSFSGLPENLFGIFNVPKIWFRPDLESSDSVHLYPSSAHLKHFSLCQINSYLFCSFPFSSAMFSSFKVRSVH